MADTTEPRARVIGGRVVARAQDGNSQPGLVAVVDVKVPPFTLYGCKLWRRRDLKMTLSAPEMERADGHSHGIRIEDVELKIEMCVAACALAKMLGANVDPIEASAD